MMEGKDCCRDTMGVVVEMRNGVDGQCGEQKQVRMFPVNSFYAVKMLPEIMPNLSTFVDGRLAQGETFPLELPHLSTLKNCSSSTIAYIFPDVSDILIAPQ